MKFFNIALLAVAAQAVSLNQMTTGPMDTTTPPMDTTMPPVDPPMPVMDTDWSPMHGTGSGSPMDTTMGPMHGSGSGSPMDTTMAPDGTWYTGPGSGSPMDTYTPPMGPDGTFAPMAPMDGTMHPGSGPMPPMDTMDTTMHPGSGPGPNDHHHHDDGSHCDGGHDDHHHQEGPTAEQLQDMLIKQDVNGDGKVGINEADKGLMELGMGDEERAAFIEEHYLGDNAGANYDHDHVMDEFKGQNDPKDGGMPSNEEVMAMMKKHDKNGDGKVGINEADQGLMELGMGDEDRAAFIEDKFLGDNAGANYAHEDVMAAMDAETDPTDAANQAQ